jgi:predicted RNA binding protein YcfA (HicA-like mRNA interferase family)
MGVSDIDLLYQELPELFQNCSLAPNWDDSLMVFPLVDPGMVTSEENDTQEELNGTRKQFDKKSEEEYALEKIGPELILDIQKIPTLPPAVAHASKETHAGRPISYDKAMNTPAPDCLSFYLPFHYYHPDSWGVYLIYEGVLWLAGEIVRQSGSRVSRRSAFEAARLFLYYHEAFHHKTECFATRLELTHRRPFFITGFKKYYKDTFNSGASLEEGLANASALDDCLNKMPSLRDINTALVKYVENSPPGYDRGNYLRQDFFSERCRFAEDNHKVVLPHLPQKNPEMWRTAPHLFHGISNINSRVYYIIARNSHIVKRLPFRPCLPPNKLIEKLKKLVGLRFVKQGKKHGMWKTAEGKKIPIPRHTKDLGRGLLKKIIEQAGLTMGIDDFLSL